LRAIPTDNPDNKKESRVIFPVNLGCKKQLLTLMDDDEAVSYGALREIGGAVA
jgi:hypothetical protein